MTRSTPAPTTSTTGPWNRRPRATSAKLSCPPSTITTDGQNRPNPITVAGGTKDLG
jgi:hypothetical protein